jgi:hypothetical protein
MRKLLLTLSIIFLLLSSCANTNPDYQSVGGTWLSSISLETDIEKFIDGNTVFFPKGTTVIEIYNVIHHLSPNDTSFYVQNGLYRNYYNEELTFNLIKRNSFNSGTEKRNTIDFFNDSVIVDSLYYRYSDDKWIQAQISSANITFNV